MVLFNSKYLIYIGIFILSMSLPAHAMRVKPMIADIQPIGKESQIIMRIDNPTTIPMMVVVQPTRIAMSIDGLETWLPADDDLLIIPNTTVVQPGASQPILVRYLGDPTIDQSVSYRVSYKQVETKYSKDSGVGVLVNFNTLIHVVPSNTQPVLKVNSVTAEDSGTWKVKIENSGNRYARLSKTNWTINNGGEVNNIVGKELKNIVEGNLILPRSVRIFEMMPIDNAIASDVVISIDSQ